MKKKTVLRTILLLIILFPLFLFSTKDFQVKKQFKDPARLPTLPRQLWLEFDDAYLAYKPSTRQLQYSAERSVLTYCPQLVPKNMSSYLYRFTTRNNPSVYFELNTRTNEFILHNDSGRTPIPCTIETRSGTAILRFPMNFLSCDVGRKLRSSVRTKSLSINTGSRTTTVTISYGDDSEIRKVSNTRLRFKNDKWGFTWDINLTTEQVHKVNEGRPFGDGRLLSVRVRTF